MKLLSYVKDEVERASYESKIAKKLGIEVEILREKGDRLNKKLQETPKKYLKKPKTTATNKKLEKLENSLLALKIYGGITKTDIPLEIPEDDTRLSELELVFNSEHQLNAPTDYEAEARALLSSYQKELDKQKITELNNKLKELDEDSDEYLEVLEKINSLQKK